MRILLLASLLAGVAACGGGGSGDAPGDPVRPLASTPIDFGIIDVASPARREVVVSNPLGSADAVITGVALSSPALAFGLDFPSLPFTLAGGRTLAFSVLWSPDADGNVTAAVEVRARNRAPLVIQVSGLAFASESVVDLGAQALTALRETAELAVDVPADAISFAIEAWGGSRTNPSAGPIHLSELIGPDGTVFVSRVDPFAGPYLFERNQPQTLGAPAPRPVDFAVFVMPNTDRPAARLVPGGGTYRFRLSNAGGFAATLSVRVHIERRLGGVVGGGNLPLNVFLSNALGVSAAAAPNDAHIQAVLGRAHTLLRDLAGIAFGDIRYFRLANPAFDTVDPNNAGPLFEQAAIATEPRLNVFLVDGALFGAAGLSGSLPGHRVNGSRYAGVYALANRGFHPDDEGTILAHEICHALGLGHTAEDPLGPTPWTHDLIDDTCPGPGCVDDPTRNLMIHQALPPGPPELTPGQVDILRRSPFVAPGAPTFVPGN